MEKDIIKITEKLLNLLGINFKKIKTETDGNIIRANIESDEGSLLIGWHGETINSLQHIIKNILRQKNKNQSPFIIIDTNEYKLRQEENVISIADKKAKESLDKGKTVSLLPMSPYFRRLVHLYISNKYKNLATESEGEKDRRYIVIKPKK